MSKSVYLIPIFENDSASYRPSRGVKLFSSPREAALTSRPSTSLSSSSATANGFPVVGRREFWKATHGSCETCRHLGSSSSATESFCSVCKTIRRSILVVPRHFLRLQMVQNRRESEDEVRIYVKGKNCHSLLEFNNKLAKIESTDDEEKETWHRVLTPNALRNGDRMSVLLMGSRHQTPPERLCLNYRIEVRRDDIDEDDRRIMEEEDKAKGTAIEKVVNSSTSSQKLETGKQSISIVDDVCSEASTKGLSRYLSLSNVLSSLKRKEEVVSNGDADFKAVRRRSSARDEMHETSGNSLRDNVEAVIERKEKIGDRETQNEKATETTEQVELGASPLTQSDVVGSTPIHNASADLTTMMTPELKESLKKSLSTRIQQAEEDWNGTKEGGQSQPIAVDDESESSQRVEKPARSEPVAQLIGCNDNETPTRIRLTESLPTTEDKGSRKNLRLSQSLPTTEGSSTSAIQSSASLSSVEKPTFRLFFLESGLDMLSHRVGVLKTNTSQFQNAVSVNKWSEATHIVIGEKAKPADVSDFLQICRKSKQLATALESISIQLVKVSWFLKETRSAAKNLSPPSWNQLWQKHKGSKRKLFDDQGDTLASKIQRHVHSQTPRSRENSQQLQRPLSVTPRNARYSELLLRLSKAYQKAPLDRFGQYKSLIYHMLAGRIKLLEFDITDDDNVWKRLMKIKGFGGSTVEKLQEFARTGRCVKLQNFRTDPELIAMKRFMGIWGVGRKIAQDFVHKGYKTLEDIRMALNSGEIAFSRNQMVGLENYDDFQEKMTREEVEAIHEIVKSCLHEKNRYPNAQISIMGSYRRGKTELGDVDLLIVSDQFVDCTPRAALGELASTLKERGHISNHLSYIDGISEVLIPGDSSDDSQMRHLGPAAGVHFGERQEGGQTYYGVFNSPVVFGKKRRIDMKWYPYRERAYAWIHFTGCGWFNRSIRLYCDKVKCWKLSDHGLFLRSTNERVLPHCSTEREVFDLIGLVYKEPCDRNHFDDVVEAATGRSALGFKDLTKSDFARDDRDGLTTNRHHGD